VVWAGGSDDADDGCAEGNEDCGTEGDGCADDGVDCNGVEACTGAGADGTVVTSSSSSSSSFTEPLLPYLKRFSNLLIREDISIFVFWPSLAAGWLKEAVAVAALAEVGVCNFLEVAETGVGLSSE